MERRDQGIRKNREERWSGGIKGCVSEATLDLDASGDDPPKTSTPSVSPFLPVPPPDQKEKQGETKELRDQGLGFRGGEVPAQARARGDDLPSPFPLGFSVPP